MGLSVVEISGMEIDLFALVCGGLDPLLIEGLVNEGSNARENYDAKIMKEIKFCEMILNSIPLQFIFLVSRLLPRNPS